MKSNWKKIGIAIGVVVLVVVAGILMANSFTQEEPYKQVELPLNNSVVNNNMPTYYDTALSIALDQAGLTGITVVINPLSDQAKSQFDGELKAHIRSFNGIYYLFIAELDREDAIEVLSHETIHLTQYQDGDISYDQNTGIVYWKGEEFNLENVTYEKRPWEEDAFQKQGQLIAGVTNILY